MRHLFIEIARKLSLGGVFVASILLISLVVLILVEITLRYFFNTSTMRADEYSGYLYLALVCFGFGHTFLRDGHIRITFLTAKLSTKASSWVDMFAGLVSVGLLLFIFYRTALLTWDSYQTGVVSEGVSATPLFIPQLALPLGFALFSLAVIAFILQRMGPHDC
ncbi:MULTISPECIES: TRAP transporter small permease [unclassified Sulfurospirillum]|uniref:TRAP transporter small permease subunit n=1 Tax=unclassified Sulfurospirillum TaxID=2618290 RepID=UPI000500AA6A|nr:MULTISPECIES: TRAP transporter small permease [unclassified Sulfurospirillum]KFL33995.1 C4-dicarboxylate ABC transporter permease [Sulfurospirillum sp. SCADC]